MTYARFDEDERPIPEMPAEFDVIIDGIEDLQAGPYTFNLTSLVRLRCRCGRIRIQIEDIEVRDYTRRGIDWPRNMRPEWRTVNEHDHLAWLITDLIRARYDTQEGQAWLRAAADRQEPEDEDERGGD